MEHISYNGQIIQVIEYDVDIGGGKKKTFEKARRAPGVRIIIQNKENQILLTREFRYELDAYDRRLPGGKVVDTLEEYSNFLDSGKDLKPLVLQASIREGKEEVGIDIQEQSIFTKRICGANMERDLRYVFVTDFTWSLEGTELGEGEIIDGHKRFSYDEIKRMIVTEEIQEGRSAGVLAKIILSS